MADLLWRHRRLAIGLAICAAVLLTVLYFVVPAAAALVGVVGGWVVLTVGLGLSHRELVEKLFGRGLAFFSWAGSAVQRQALASEIQGVINGGRRDLDDELGDLMPYRASVQFVREETDLAQLRDGVVVIALRHPRKHAENTARATLGYISTGTALPARPYVDRKAMQSVDYSLAKKLLSSADRGALDYLLTQMWLPAVDRDAELRELGRMAEAIEAEGWLTRVLLTEYLEVGRRLFGRFPPAEVQAASRRFLEFLYAVAHREPSEHVPLDFRDSEFRVAIVLVGAPELRERLGALPYIQRALDCQRRGYDAVHLLARGLARPVFDEVVQALRSHGRVVDVEVSELSLRGKHGSATAAFGRVVFDQGDAHIGRSAS